MKKFYITTPIYYVNDLPHIGHTYTTILADVISRYYEFLGLENYMLTGTDEHATKILEIANKNGIEPKKYCDEVVLQWKNTWKSLDIKYSRFIRTTDIDHISTVKKVLTILNENGDIYKSNYEGLYCIHCEKFISQEDLIDGKCPDHNVEPKKYQEENYFFKLSKYKEKIVSAIESDEIKIIPQTRKNEVLGKLALKLDDISISRKRSAWGIQLPFDQQQTTYVWIDALINYLSGVDYFKLSNNKLKTTFWPADLQLMAKDILWFHAVIWTGILMAIKAELPKKLYVHGFFTVNGQKMSKTIGNVIKPKELIDIFGVDATRLLLIYNIVSGVDGDFSISSLVEKYNQLLANNLGNLVSRTFAMLKKYFDNKLKTLPASDECINKIVFYKKNYVSSMENVELNKVIENIFEISSFANKYIQNKTPWLLAKNGQMNQLKQVMSDLLYYIKATALLLLPVMPQTSQKILQLYNENLCLNIEFQKLVLENKINIFSENFNDAEILFKKI